MSKYQRISCIADKTDKAINLYQNLADKYKFVPIDENSQIIIVLGGDGFMLETLHKYMHLDVAFFGINCGTVGFLLNDLDNDDDFLNRIESAKITNINPLMVNATDIDGKIINMLAINEVYLFRQTTQTTKLQLTIDNIVRIEELVGDGIVISTSAGSSAYNFAVGGPILPLESNILSIYAISPFRPRRWKGALLPNKVSIDIKVIDYIKRPSIVVADLNEYNNIVSARISQDFSKNIQLLFDPGHSLEDRIIREQFI